jgi:glycosyltransferase involved in cell wall biosynthesis
LHPSLDSVLNQEGVSFELVVVDDGSTDDTAAVLTQLAREDSRVRVLSQPNGGLTRALVRGCAEARGEYIARHDAGDLSLPGRLETQAAFLQQHPEITIVSCWTRRTGPEGEKLDEVTPTTPPPEATARLCASSLSDLQGPTHHGSVLFRKTDYLRAGGYRAQFYYAQDLDLWTRLAQYGMLAFLPIVLYEARFDENCISACHRPQQIELARIILLLGSVRSRGESEDALLAQAEQIRPWPKRPSSSKTKAPGNYWIARMLQKQGDSRALHYYRRAIQQDPFFWRARLALFLNRVGMR